MSAPGAVFYKSSGELLAEGNGGCGWTPQGVTSYADKLARLYRQREQLNLQGIITVSGAGNRVRGDELAEQGLAPKYKDAIGRLATLENVLMIADALEARRIPCELFVAPPMRFTDLTTGEIPPYQHGLARKAVEDDKVVLIGGGKGTDGNTTDGAVMWYAQNHRENDTATPVTVLKGTKIDGVYDGDPSKTAGARRYAEISAHTMLEDYDRFRVVDRESLEIATASGLRLYVYRDAAHDIAEVLNPGAEVGTVIHGKPIEARFAA